MTRRCDWQTCRQNEKQLGEKKLFEVWRKLHAKKKRKYLNNEIRIKILHKLDHHFIASNLSKRDEWNDYNFHLVLPKERVIESYSHVFNCLLIYLIKCFHHGKCWFSFHIDMWRSFVSELIEPFSRLVWLFSPHSNHTTHVSMTFVRIHAQA